jgi:hypothetical protein
VLPEGLGKLKKCIHLIGSGTHDLPACSIAPLPLKADCTNVDVCVVQSLFQWKHAVLIYLHRWQLHVQNCAIGRA